MTLIEAAKQALEALEQYASHRMGSDFGRKAITALRTAIKQAKKQEPVAWRTCVGGIWFTAGKKAILQKELESINSAAEIEPLYTTPRAAQRQPLTEEQIETIHQSTWMQSTATLNDFARAIEAAHGIGEKK